MQRVVAEALRSIPAQRLWINPDCGLKTRNWTETRAALAEMVQMARQVRAQLGHGKTHPLPQSADVLA
jgi:5-methyltetrahydropteroyltriglutamate--homocysteine methyltransferase